MKNIGSKIFGLFVLSLLGTLLYLTVFSDDGLGSAPDITIPISETRDLHLNKPMRPIIVLFWATSCPPCIEKMPYLADMKQRLGGRFEIVAIAMDYDPEKHIESFLAANDFPFIFINDKYGTMAKDFGGVLLTPTSFLIAPNGRIVYRRIGDMDLEQVEKRIIQMSPRYNPQPQASSPSLKYSL